MKMREMGKQPPVKRRRGNPAMVKGGPSLNPSGRPKKLVAIEAMLDSEHRNLDNMKAVFDRLRALALGEVVTVTDQHGRTDIELQADPAYMKLYLERVMGPVRELEPDLSHLPDDVIRALADAEPN